MVFRWFDFDVRYFYVNFLLACMLDALGCYHIYITGGFHLVINNSFMNS